MAHEAAKPQLTPERWQQVKAVFAELIEMPETDRPGFLATACSHDSDLRIQVEELLRGHDATGAAGLELAPVTSIAAAVGSQLRLSAVGCRIGSYRIEAEVAHGGMGTVYRAVRADDEYKKQVAIKVMDRGMLSRRGTELFRHERQILASLEHPNIARLLDGGTSEDGSPYLVMEYVEGRTITQYCDAHRLTVEERLRLFQKICSAVYFAHQNLIVHRDIKPANILVTADGEPKLLDFGIAKILDSNSAETQTRTVGAMTPAYASPEQLNGHPVTTGTDVYSLGLVLYELLTGRYAYEQFPTPVRRQQAILEEDPERPSQAVLRNSEESEQTTTSQQIGALRQLPVEKLSKRLAGDLESIIGRAIRKEPEHRYRSVDQLSDDIRRHLAGLPVLARNDTFLYRASKFTSRHRFGVTAATVVAMTVVAALIVTLHEARIARSNEVRAERRFNDVRSLANSLMFEISDSIQQLPGATPARKLLAQRAQEYLDKLAQDAGRDPAFVRELATAYSRLADVQGGVRYSNLGNTAMALQNYQKAVDLLESVLPLLPNDDSFRCQLAQAYLDLSAAVGNRGGDKALYRELTRKGIDIAEGLVRADPSNAKAQLVLGRGDERKAQYLRYENDISQSLSYELKALDVLERLAKTDPQSELYQTELAHIHRDSGAVLAIQKQWTPALAHYEIARALDEEQVRRYPDNVGARWDLSVSYSNTGFILARVGKPKEALDYYSQALRLRLALMAADGKDFKAASGVAMTYSYISWIYQRENDLFRAIEYKKKSIAVRERFVQNDAGNKVTRENLVWAIGELGELYSKLAVQAYNNPRRQRELCGQSVALLDQAIPVLTTRENEGRMWGAEDLTPFRAELENCRRLIGPNAEEQNQQARTSPRPN